MPRFRRRFFEFGGRMSPGHYLRYSVWLAMIAALLVWVGTWALAWIAGYNGWQPGDARFEILKNTGFAVVGVFTLWALVAMAVKRARDAHIPTLAFKAGLPALVLFDHFGLGRMTDDRLVGPLSGLTPIAALVFAGVFLLLVLAPRAPVTPLEAADMGEAALN